MPLVTLRFTVEDKAACDGVLADIADAGGTAAACAVAPGGEAVVTFMAADLKAFRTAFAATPTGAAALAQATVCGREDQEAMP